MMIKSVNTWSLEQYLGPLREAQWDEARREPVITMEDRPVMFPLLELPARLREQGFTAAEVSYAQFPERTELYLNDLRGAFAASGVTLTSLLIDYGDLSAADEVRREADFAWCKGWIDTAAQAGAKRVRIRGGDAEPADEAALRRSAEAMLRLEAYAAQAGIRVVTENLGKLLSTADSCLQFLDLCGGRIGFTADFGNFGKDKHAQLARVLPYAETVHAKPDLKKEGGIDTDDFNRCLQLCIDQGFRGVYSFTYLGEGEPWSHLAELRQNAERTFGMAK